MSPVEHSTIAAAVRGPVVGSIINQVALSRDRGNSFEYLDLPSINFISTLAFSVSGSMLYVNTFGSAVNTIYQCGIAAWACLNTGSISIGYVQQFAVPRGNDNKAFALATRARSDYRDPQVYYFDGSMWTDITIQGSALDNAPLGGAIAYISKGTSNVNTVVVATSQGLLIPNGKVGEASFTDWTLIAIGLPVVPVMDMIYESTDDILVLATMGRGVWYLPGASVLVELNVRT